MKIAYMVLGAMLFLYPAFAQERSKEPLPQGMGGKTMESCKVDVERFAIEPV